ncbi:MAG: hypothetical protein AAFQ87_22480, partial [Bacteroidota bacterium]
MKNLLSFCCLSLCFLFACQSPQYVSQTAPNSGQFPFANWHQVSDGLYAYRYELDNIGYKEFLAASPNACRPDSNAWSKIEASVDPFKETYFNHPAFNQYPVVN